MDEHVCTLSNRVEKKVNEDKVDQPETKKKKDLNPNIIFNEHYKQFTNNWGRTILDLSDLSLDLSLRS